jgi:hypothetical protein
MSLGGKVSFGTLGRLVAAGAATYAGARLGHPALGVALATVATSYFVNRANAVEGQFEEDSRASKNHHLQLALAGAFRITLKQLEKHSTPSTQNISRYSTPGKRSSMRLWISPSLSCPL